MKKITAILIIAALALGALLIVLELDHNHTWAQPAPRQPAANTFGGGSGVGDAILPVLALATGDLDHDGDPDLVSGAGKLIGWENDTTPFTGLWSQNTIGTPDLTIHALILGDLDNDGDLDLASGSEWTGGYEVVVWQNEGTPFSGHWNSNDVGNADGVLSLASGDLDNDGDLDLVSGDDGAGVIAWQNDGSPFGGLWALNTVGSGSTDVTALVVGDLDNDGDLDIVGGNADNRVRVWENDGTPFDSAWSAHDVFTTTGGIASLTLSDVDGDGDLDILAGCTADELYALVSWQNNGSPFDSVWTRHDVGDKDLGTIHALAAADFDVDGDPDLASSAQLLVSNAELRTWENNGSPFAGTWANTDVAQATTDVRALAVADLDLDGDPDLIAATNLITAWPNTRALGAWTEWTQGAQPTPADDTLSVALADFDHDGKLDVATGTGGMGDGVRVWRGDGGYTWTQVGGGLLPVTGTWPAVSWGQINNTDELDLAAAGTEQGLRAWIASQGGAVWENVSTGLPTGGDYKDVALAHVNHDGQLDLAACGKSVGVRTWQNNGGPTTSWTSQKIYSNTMNFCGLDVGDVNHDGDLDIAAANCGNSVGIPLWLGDGSFGATASLPVTTTGDYQAVALGDVNNDGDADVVAAVDSVGGVRVWLGDGGTSWSYQGTLSPTLTVLSLDLGDFDNDGYLDILAGLLSNGVRVWRGDGGASWTAANTGLATAQHFASVAFGRVDADATLDVVGAESGTSGVRVWTSVEPPPGGWTNFTRYPDPYSPWVRSQQVTCTVQVADVGSGMDVSTAQYRFSRNGGESWVGGWISATMSGLDGSTVQQVMTATNVPFDQDSETNNAIQFLIRDLAGLTGTSPIYYVAVDATPPSNPSDLTSPDHTPGAWSDDASIRITWTDIGSDGPGGSGIWGYSWVMDQISDTLPDETTEQGAGPGNLIDLWGIPDGDWYFHFTARDRAGNWSIPAHLGPYRIDTGPPTTPTLTTSTPTAGGWSADTTIFVNWDATDGNGVVGYSYAWDTHPTQYVDTTSDTSASSTTSDPLSDGEWYFHVRAIDEAENAGPTAHFGPFGVDTVDPSGCWLNVPRYSNSFTCLVEWSSSDADSGVANYDVQVRDDTYGIGTWENWLVETTGVTEIYTDANIGTYSFRVRARDQAGNINSYGCEDQTIVEDLGVIDLEVTQGIQNLSNDAPLITDKTTYVRFYVASLRVDVSNIDARLHGTRGGSSLPGSPLRPAGGRITALAGGGDRENVDDSFYFRLPPEWRSGEVELRAVLDPGDELPEDEWLGNEIVETITFESSNNFCIVFLPVHLHPSTYHTGDAGFWDMVELMKWLYPVGNDSVGIYEGVTVHPAFHWLGREWSMVDDLSNVLGRIGLVDFWTDDPCHDTHYFGMIHPDSYPGSGSIGIGERYNTVVGDDAAGIMFISRGSLWPEPVGGMVMAHELGHNFRRKHVDCTGDEAAGGAVDTTYPYPGCQIGPNSSIAYYGFWNPPGGPPEVISPTAAADIMSYNNRTWVSDWTYRALLDELRDLSRAQDASPAFSPAWTQANEYLFAAGVISPTAQTAELWPFYRTSEPDMDFVARSFQQELDTALSDSAYSLVLEDGAGQLLYTHTFTAPEVSDFPGNVLFAEVFPYNEQAARVVLKQGELELGYRLVSSHAPTVTVTTPNGEETVDGDLTIAWTASDDDGDDLLFTVQYSPDDGATWHSLAIDWPETTVELAEQDMSGLPGSDQARVRVIATDGANTAEDQSDVVFSLAAKPPRAYIIAPDSGSQFAPDDTLVFQGAALDAEDGPGNPSIAITWTSSLSGTLGAGTELWVSNLTTGTHHIVLSVTDSDGQTGTDEIILFVGIMPNRVYLPIILRDQ